MISDFIYKYYIDPIRYEQPYNTVETLTYAIILVIAVWLLYRWFNRTQFPLDGRFVLATIPYIILGGVLRVVQDTHMIAGDIQFAIVTPFIYFVLFAYTFGWLLLSRYLQKKELCSDFLQVYAGAGTLSVVCVSLVLAAWSMTHTGVDLFILAIIPLMAITATAIVWAFMRYVLK